MDWRVFGTAFVTLFLAELGDKTQLAVITMTANTESKVAVFLGASLALVFVSLLGVVLVVSLAGIFRPNGSSGSWRRRSSSSVS